ncbi:MAG: protein-L-isoaspartate O-methyltransferase [Candidatus Syntropharchaeia archaeon]
MSFEEEREGMVTSLRFYHISERVLEAMRRVPRHLFVPEDLKSQAYVDKPLPIGSDQTISAPHMVGIMCDLLDLKERQKVLEIGAGSGYHAAVVSELIGKEGHVYTVERLKSLAETAEKNLKEAGYENVTIVVGDGSLGLPEYAPYDRINVTCAAPDVPPPLLDQLKVGGKMVIPIGREYQDLYLIEKRDEIRKKKECGVMFVPLIGKYGFGSHD